MKSRKGYMLEGIEQTNQERIRRRAEKENNKYLGIVEVKMKEKRKE